MFCITVDGKQREFGLCLGCGGRVFDQVEYDLHTDCTPHCGEHKTWYEGYKAECVHCGSLGCPHSEPLHYHHDGCPARPEDLRLMDECSLGCYHKGGA